MTIKNISVEDLSKIAQLDQDIYEKDAYPYTFFRQAHEICSDTLLGAYINNEPIGYILAQLNNQRTKALITVLCVSKSYRRQGIGRQLLQAIKARVSKYDIPLIELSVDPQNINAKKLYLKSGFNIARHDPAYFGENNPRDILIYSLKPELV